MFVCLCNFMRITLLWGFCFLFGVFYVLDFWELSVLFWFFFCFVLYLKSSDWRDAGFFCDSVGYFGWKFRCWEGKDRGVCPFFSCYTLCSRVTSLKLIFILCSLACVFVFVYFVSFFCVYQLYEFCRWSVVCGVDSSFLVRCLVCWRQCGWRHLCFLLEVGNYFPFCVVSLSCFSMKSG